MPNFSAFDNSGRTPRPLQVATAERLNEDWTNTNVHALILPTGSGKSAIARTIQVATGADIITPSNILVEQYASDYTNVNVLKGASHYTCHSGMTCKDWKACGLEYCEDCPYERARNKAAEGQRTFFNPMSYYYFLLNTRSKGSKVLVVDEAHQLNSMMLMLCSKRLKKSEYKFNPDCCNEVYLAKWLGTQIGRLERLCALYQRRNELEKLAKCKGEIDTLSLLKQGLEEDGQNYVIWVTKVGSETYLNIKPLFPPRFLMDRIIGGKKLILMSGTLFDYDIRATVGNTPYKIIEQGSPIPKENRKIIYKPAPFKINYQTDPKKLVDYIETFLDEKQNTIIHSTYSLSKKLAPLFTRKVIFNTAEDKDAKLAEFKANGGVFLASGCAEGIDLRDDFCRLNIIPKLAFPDLGDPAVIKRKAMQDGQEWYALATLQTLIQQAGRSTRNSDDYSTIYILDPNFLFLFMKYRRKLPRYFVESVII